MAGGIVNGLHPAAEELARDLADERMYVAAAAVREGSIALASAIAAELTDDFGPLARKAEVGRLLASHVSCWAVGDLDAVAVSNTAWHRNGCLDCARRALLARDAESYCGLCLFNRSAREARS